jgi:cell division protein FtsQ
MFVTLWVMIGGGMITILAAAMKQQKSERCSNYSIIIQGARENLFVDEKEVIKILETGAGGKIIGRSRSAFDLMKMEQLLEKNVWVKDAELYFDNREVLHVKVKEREPVARVFTMGGKTWYIDQDEMQMPISPRLSANVPVFTGFPVKKVVSKKDKELLHEVRVMAEFINKDPFWMAQVAQIDITPDREFEMVPVVGNHVVKLGKGNDIETKFRRLFIFYSKVLSKAGFDKYRTIDVQFEGQVIGVKGYASKVDSIQLRKNVQNLLQLARDVQNDTLVPVAPTIARPSIESSTRPASEVETPATTLNKPSTPQGVESNPDPVKPFLAPKAVMPKRDQ